MRPAIPGSSGGFALPFKPRHPARLFHALNSGNSKGGPGLRTGWMEAMIRYPRRLYHRTPAWVESESTFHIRISATQVEIINLTASNIGPQLLTSAELYHEQVRWHCRLFLLMPDHLHALLVFRSTQSMGNIIASWKGYQAKRCGITWQSNFFDHRIRDQRELEDPKHPFG
jgi:putative transposase